MLILIPHTRSAWQLFVSVCLTCGLMACGSTQSASTTSSRDGAAPYRLPNFPSATYFYTAPRSPVLVSAHRAQPELDGFPENAISSIKALTARGSYVLEMDVSMSSDGVLFLFHDDELDRLTVHSGNARERQWSDLDTMRLRDRAGTLTTATIPTLVEALAATKGKALVTLDRKKGVPFETLDQAVQDAGVDDEVALILYSEKDFVEWANLFDVGPISYGAPDLETIERLAQQGRELYALVGRGSYKKRSAQPMLLFVGVGEPDYRVLARAEYLNLKTIVGTFGLLDETATKDKGATYVRLAERGVSVLATNQPIAAYAALEDYNERAEAPPRPKETYKPQRPQQATAPGEAQREASKPEEY